MDWEKAAASDRGYNKAGLPTRAVVRGLEGLAGLSFGAPRRLTGARLQITEPAVSDRGYSVCGGADTSIFDISSRR